jgi:hypothetical protein
MAFRIVNNYFSLILSRLAVQIRPYVNQDRIIVRIILNLVIARNACGSLAGIITISPAFNRDDLPEITTSTSPSRR